jgi:outer membrane lipoprotein-sorting protein
MFSCAPTRKITTERSLSLDDVLGRVKERNEKIKTLSGEGTITVESSESSTSGSFTVDMKKPDSLRMEFRGPFGIRAATLMLSREKFFFYNWMENTTIVGTPDGKTLNSILRLKMQFDQIINTFTGEIRSVGDRDSLLQYSVENNYYVMRYQSPEGKKECWIDGDSFIVTDYRATNDQGETVLIANTSDPEEIGEVQLPTFIRVVFPKESQGVTIAYDEIKINEPVSCRFVFPKQAEIIYR